MVEKITLSAEEAIAALPEGNDIHTILNGPGCPAIVGADYSRERVLKIIKEAPLIFIPGGIAQRMKHGIAIPRDDDYLYIETANRTDV